MLKDGCLGRFLGARDYVAGFTISAYLHIQAGRHDVQHYYCCCDDTTTTKSFHTYMNEPSSA